MKRIIMALLVMLLLTAQVSAMDFQAPQAPEEVAELIPETADSFAQGLWNVIRWALSESDSALRDAMSACLSVAAVVLMSALLGEMTTALPHRTLQLCAAIAAAGILLEPSSALIGLGTETTTELNEYGKLLLPVMTGALAAQGGVTTSAALYTATALFNTVLSSLLTRLAVPMLYLYLALSIGGNALNAPLLEKMREFIRWGMTWVLKLVLYLFTGYITVTGVIHGNADAAAVRAARITISGAVPVVGGILSDASEAVMISAGTLGSAAGVYGLITVLALFAGPFVRIGIQYLLLKATAALCQSMESSSAARLIADFSGALGILLGMVSTQTVLLMISTLCFMKGVS